MVVTNGEPPLEDLETDRLIAWFDARRAPMIDLLRDLVNTDSHTHDKSGVDRVIAKLRVMLESHNVPVREVEQPVAGNFLHADLRAEGSNAPPVMLLGHCDTVFPRGEAARRPFSIEGTRAYGPGVADMKGGLVINAFVLAAIREFYPEGLPVCALFTSDEEIASPVSRPEIEQTTRHAAVVFNGEPGRPAGNVTVGRKGGLFLRLDVTGRAAHSGSHFTHGISAIEALARKIVELHALTDLERGVTVNVGVIGGGLTLNTVAPGASAEFELRYVRQEDRDPFLDKIRSIVATEHVAGATAELTISGEFLPLVQSDSARELYAAYDAAAARVGVHFGQEFSGGCSDAGVPCSLSVPTLCGVGPVGGGAHTVEEYIELDTLVTRAQTLALASLRLALDTPARREST